MTQVDCKLTPCKSCGYRTKTWEIKDRTCYRCGACKTRGASKK